MTQNENEIDAMWQERERQEEVEVAKGGNERKMDGIHITNKVITKIQKQHGTLIGHLNG